MILRLLPVPILYYFQSCFFVVRLDRNSTSTSIKLRKWHIFYGLNSKFFSKRILETLGIFLIAFKTRLKGTLNNNKKTFKIGYCNLNISNLSSQNLSLTQLSTSQISYNSCRIDSSFQSKFKSTNIKKSLIVYICWFRK